MNICLTLFLMFLKVGITCFGGGYGMMSMILDEGAKLVGLTADEFTDMTALDLICSGPIALNSSTYVGYIKGGVPGSFFATLGLVLPTVAVSILAVIFMQKFSENRIVKGLFRGITPACGGLLIYTAVTLFLSAFFGSETVFGLSIPAFTMDTAAMAVLFIAAGFLVFRSKIDPVLLTVIGAVFGLIFLR